MKRKIKSISDLITNSSSEVYIFTVSEKILEFLKNYTGNLEFILVQDKESLLKIMTDTKLIEAQEKISDYCDANIHELSRARAGQIPEIFERSYGKIFLFSEKGYSQIRDWYISDTDYELIKIFPHENYIG